MGLSASRATSQFCGRRANKNQAPEDVEALIPEPHQRPSDCPEGYICLFESYFTEGGLWFPLPEFLTSYCSRRNIAFSQLSVASIRNAVGLVILAAEERLVVDLDLFEEVTSFSIGVKNPSMVCANSRRGFKIFYGATRFVPRPTIPFFRILVFCARGVLYRGHTCSNILLTVRHLHLVVNLSFLFGVNFAFIFLILPRYHVGSPSCLRMGSCELPRYADQFDDDEELVCEDEPQVPIDEPIHEGSAEATDTVDVCVVKREVPNKDRATERDSSRRSPETGPSNIGKPPRHGTPIRNAVEGVDHSFSFNYDARDHMFHNDGSACAELARNVRANFSEFPQVETLLAPDLYHDVCRQKFQEMSQTNRMVGFYEKKVREVMRESDLLKVALETARKSLATSRADRHYEKSREDAVAVERRKVVTEIEDSHAQCLETMIAKGTAIPEARMKILAKGRPIWQSKGRCDRGSGDSRKRPRPLPSAAERWGRRHRCVI
ncbi:unnamed protein product [Arabidopsis thaliana]|uniref:Uncharacterized protein n=1 Tax=Arabidopsis thaliana TaxID=3702 RepID=A0A5S9XI29_ARATH|nr:unnamed protein product [Arabidopsis thaliana]